FYQTYIQRMQRRKATVHKISGYKIFEKEVIVRPGYLNNSVTEK
ncbi:14975_t:CDS:2, partial [Funneliformis mosseae]